MNIGFAMQVQRLERELDKCKVSHILHLVLSLLTGGLWLFVWAVLVDQNKRKERELEDQINKFMDLAMIDT